ncbi:Fructose-2,6-bisphosphatase [Dipsacomyces acuminosporus]|nr:Fructose-2,6-bisphosphatase [Dipsacomyces acuminosporus]
MSYKVSRYLAWLGVNCRVFNVGEYRRKIVGAQLDHSFFDPGNPVAIEQRYKCAVLALSDMLQWFADVHNGVAIYDATNSTRARRKMISDECKKHGIDVMFFESWCDDEDLINMNIREVKRTSPDYKGVKDIQQVIDDFRRRINHYSEVYEPVGGDGTRPFAKKPYPLPPTNPTLEEYDEKQASFVRKINVGSQVVINRITSYLESRIVYFLMNIHIAPRSILFSRHGESIYNLTQRLGGDPGLSPNGRKYADALPGLISKLLGDQPLTVWTSTLKRTHETAAGLPYKKLQWKALDELDAGLCDGLTYEDVERMYPEEYALRDENKFEFRYRGGESYRDVVLRLEPVIMELERQQNIMIISHQAVLRCIYAYFLDIGPEELPYLKIPLHTVMKLTWTAYGCDIQTYKIDIDAVDTHRAKPKSLKRSGTIKSSASSSSKGPNTAGTGENSRLSSPVVRPEDGTSRLSANEQPPSTSSTSAGTKAEDTQGRSAAKEMPLPTPPAANAPPPAKAEASPSAGELLVDAGTIPSAFQAVPAPDAPQNQARDAGFSIQGMQSSLSVSGGHDQGSIDGHMGHVWPSQISPGVSRENSRPPSPSHEDPVGGPLVHREGSAHSHPSHAYPGRSDPRKGSPVYLSPSDYATSFEVHSHRREVHAAEGHDTPMSEHQAQQSQSPAAASESSGRQPSSYTRQPLLASLKIDELHIAGHGNVDIVESKPTISLRYSSNVPKDVRKQTDALKNELVGIEDEDTDGDNEADVASSNN